MDSLEEEIVTRKRLKQTDKDPLVLPELLPTKIEIDELIRIVRPLYIQKKIEDLPFEMERRELPQTLFGQRITEKTTPRLIIIRKCTCSKQVQDNAYNKLNEQVIQTWYVCLTKVSEVWNQKYTKNPIRVEQGPIIKG